jgi:hypothetical protein
MRKWTRLIAVTLIVSVFLAGCGQDMEGFIKNEYQLVDVQGSGNNMQKVYRAPNSTVPEVAKQIAKQDKPDEISAENDERMFLVYGDRIVHVQQDPQKKEDVLVEVDTKQFVREHYDPSFLEGFLAASLITSMFGSNWRSYPHTGYSGYGDSYKYKDPRTSPGYTVPKTPYTNPGGGSGSYTPPKSSKGTGRVIRKK